ncbi:MAG TPA: VWA domain-containing protein, partial [Terriglobales bacterium]|nr:VWA domain-containing protein [Terriglobales bacterium]
MMCVPGAQSQAAAQASSPQTSPQAQTGGDEMEEPLKPDELTVPSNAALLTMTPAPTVPAGSTTASSSTSSPASHPANQPSDTVQVKGREVRQQGKVFTIQAEVDEVVLHATVVDDHQRLITNLDRNAFTVLEDGQAQPITSFRHEDVPVAVGILVDNSGSMRNKRAAVTQAAVNFVKASNPDDRVFVVNFNDEAYIDQDFTNSIPKLREALDRIDARGGTAL